MDRPLPAVFLVKTQLLLSHTAYRNGHQSAVITEVRVWPLADSDRVFTKLTLTPLGSGKQDTNGPCILFPDMGSFGKFFLLYTAPPNFFFFFKLHLLFIAFLAYLLFHLPYHMI